MAPHAAVAAPLMIAPPPVEKKKPAVEWKWVDGKDGSQIHLLHWGDQIGTLWVENGNYYAFKDDDWTGPCSMPEGVPHPIGAGALAPMKNYGIDLNKCHSDEEVYKINGKTSCKRAAIKALQEASLADDSNRLRLTVIGTEAETKPVLNDLATNSSLVGLKDKIHVHDYTPDHFSIAGLGFPTTGHPTICIQTPDGKVVHRNKSTGTYEGPAALFSAIRKADPTYDPTKDPDLNHPPAPPAPAPMPMPAMPDFLKQIPTGVWIILAVVVGAFLLNRSKGTP